MRHVLAKLVTGETLMAVVNYEDDHNIELAYPMEVGKRTVDTPEGEKEMNTISVFSQFVSDRFFFMRKQDFLFIKDLHKNVTPYYETMVYKLDELYSFEDMPFDTVNEMRNAPETVDDVKEKLDRLREMLGMNNDSTEEEEESHEVYDFPHDGKRTIH